MLKGVPANPGSFRGPATLGEPPQDSNGTKWALVLRQSGPEIFIYLDKIGAIIAEEGGVLCHAAIVAREYGIPCIVGCAGATTTIKPGDTVELDATSGTVVLASEHNGTAP